MLQFTDQNGTVHRFTRDLLGRPTLDAVVTVPDSVDQAVLAIGLSYEARSLIEKITSYAAASGPGSTVVNEVENVYDDFWQLQKQFQEHSGRSEHLHVAERAVRLCGRIGQYGPADGHYLSQRQRPEFRLRCVH